jgi:uncharacterized protein YbjQ (UPF0145 family)
MKTKDIAKVYGIDNDAFDVWLQGKEYLYKRGVLGGIDVDDIEDIPAIVYSFKQHQVREPIRIAQEQERLAREASDREHAAQLKQAALAGMLITSGFNFDGYTITKYSGYISGDGVVQVSRGTDGIFATVTDAGTALMASLAMIRRNALKELKEAAYALGCNAVIGVDFDYITLDPETANFTGGTTFMPYIFGVTANGNAVVIEKNGPRRAV